MATNTQNIATNAGDIDTLEAAVAALPTPASRVQDAPNANTGVLIGAPTSANGKNSVAMGTSTSAGGEDSVAMGYGSSAGGKRSISGGAQASSTKENAISLGDHAQATGNNATAIGQYATASGSAAAALGAHNTANANNSLAGGYYSETNQAATTSVALGNRVSTTQPNQFACGKCNDTTDTNLLFMVGNGADAMNKSNAFAVKLDGTLVFANGTEITPTQFASLLALLTPT